MRQAVFSHAPFGDLDDEERIELFETITAFRKACRKSGHEAVVRALPADPEGHAQRRKAKGGR